MHVLHSVWLTYFRFITNLKMSNLTWTETLLNFRCRTRSSKWFERIFRAKSNSTIFVNKGCNSSSMTSAVMVTKDSFVLSKTFNDFFSDRSYFVISINTSALKLSILIQNFLTLFYVWDCCNDLNVSKDNWRIIKFGSN